MKCLNCSFDNPEGMKFCGQCGAPLCSLCSNCGHSNPVQAESCKSCGLPLTPPRPRDDVTRIQKYIPAYLAEKILQSKDRIEGERKNVTVVFADISGFTSLAETRDPEEVTAITNACLTVLGGVVCEYEGVVDKFLGDGLMAIFSIPTHEDDPERAILASIQMQQEMKELSRKFEESKGISLGISIGINTGIVIIGDVGTALRMDYTVIGDVVNTASRLQETAKSGETLVTHETYKRSRHCFDFQELAPVRVKGKSQPVQVYKVIRRKEKPLSKRGIEGLRAPFIGRDKEFAKGKRVVDELVKGKGGALFITGAAGLGKSRLAEELKEYAICQGIVWLEGKCVSYAHSINYWVFVDALKNYFSVASKDDLTEIERKIRDKIAAGSIDESSISTICLLLSSKLRTERILEDLAESEKKMRIFAAVRDVLAAGLQSNSMILMFEDLHWVDELSMELFLFLMEELSQDRITFIGIHRLATEEDDSNPIQALERDNLQNKSEKSPRYTRIVLNPLPSNDSSMLLKSLLAVEDLPPEMKKLILEKAGGNPLYLEEVIRVIIDDRIIEQRDGKWLAVKEVEDIEVPSTVQEVIVARIDRLREEPKFVLQCASVVGRSFGYDLLSYLVNKESLSNTLQVPRNGEISILDDALQRMLSTQETHSARRIYDQTLDENLAELRSMGFIAHEEGSENSFRFRHVLIQDVTYSTILRRRRKKLHEMVGNYIENAHSPQLEEHYESLAYHYSYSDNTEKALSYLVKAGNKNRESPTGSAENALRYFRKSSEILEDSALSPEDSARHRQSIYDGMGEAYIFLGRYEESLGCFETVLRVSDQVKDFRMKAKALRKIAVNKDQIGDWEAALKAYEESLSIVRTLGDLIQMGFVYNNIGYGYSLRSKHEEAMEYFKEALRMGEESGDLRLIADASNNLGMLASQYYDLDEAIRNYQISLEKYKELGDVHGESQVYQNLGIMHFQKNEMDIADEYYEESLKISEKCSYSKLKVYTYLNRSELCLWRSDLDRAEDFCRKAFQILHNLNDKWGHAEGFKLYGMIYRRQGKFRSAADAFQTSLVVSEECKYLANVAEVHCEMGAMYKEEGLLEEALEHFGKSREIFDDLEIVEEVQKIDEHIAEIRSAKG